MTDQQITDWHLRAHDQVEERLGEVVSLLYAQRDEIAKVNIRLAEIQTEKKVRAIAGSYIVPGFVSILVTFLVKKLGLI